MRKVPTIRSPLSLLLSPSSSLLQLPSKSCLGAHSLSPLSLQTLPPSCHLLARELREEGEQRRVHQGETRVGEDSVDLDAAPLQDFCQAGDGVPCDPDHLHLPGSFQPVKTRQARGNRYSSLLL